MNRNVNIVVCNYQRTKKQTTHCVEARVFPSGLNAAAMVDLGGGIKGQYLADKCRNDSASTLKSSKDVPRTQHIPIEMRTGKYNIKTCVEIP